MSDVSLKDGEFLRPLFKSISSFFTVAYECFPNILEISNVISHLFPMNRYRYTFASCSATIVEQNAPFIFSLLTPGSLNNKKNALTILVLESFCKYK
jgi:hypothetical protein